MPANDTYLLDGIIENYVKQIDPNNTQPADQTIGRAFDKFAVEQALKEYEPTEDNLVKGNVDGRNDGGIDDIFIVVNGHIVDDIASFMWPKSNAVLDLLFITCKHHNTFQKSPIDDMIASISELLDFRKEESDFIERYNRSILNARKKIIAVYRKVANALTNTSICFFYLSRGDTLLVGDNVKSRADQLTSICNELFRDCSSTFTFLGSRELLEMYRKRPKYSLSLISKDHMTLGNQYIALVSLVDYYNFLSDDDGKLRKYLFDSNVRDYLGLNPVNKDIMETLTANQRPDFWWLNNGITIVSSRITTSGNQLFIENVQIVNGSQTSESIFRYFEGSEIKVDDRHVLIRIIQTDDKILQDEIIKSTNNQTAVVTSALHATEKIQRDIEEVLLKHGYYYGRRTNSFENLGIPSKEVITPLSLASGYVAIVIKDINKAKSLKSKFMRNEALYNTIFNEKIPINIWVFIASMFQKVDAFLYNARPSNANETRYVKEYRHLLAFITTSKILSTYNYNIKQLADLSREDFQDEDICKTWAAIQQVKLTPQTKGNKWKSSQGLMLLFSQVGEVLNIAEFDLFALHKKQFNSNNEKPRKSRTIDDEFLDIVNKLLPDQPWKRNIHKEIAGKLGCTNSNVFNAINILVERGIRKRQINGAIIS